MSKKTNKQTNRQRARKRSQSQNLDKTEMKSLDPFSKQIEQFNIGICRGIPESLTFYYKTKEMKVITTSLAASSVIPGAVCFSYLTGSSVLK